MKTPKGATHIWTEAVENPLPAMYGITTLSYYKKVDDEWWVYSPESGWRKSRNDQQWFDSETEEGIFKEIH